MDRSSSFLMLITPMMCSSEAVFSPEVNACLQIVSTHALMCPGLRLAGIFAASFVSESGRYNRYVGHPAHTDG